MKWKVSVEYQSIPAMGELHFASKIVEAATPEEAQAKAFPVLLGFNTHWTIEPANQA